MSSFAGQRLLHAVDDGELGRALALGLVAPGVEQRHRHAGGDGLQQAHLGLAEGVLALVVFQLTMPKMRSPAIIGTDTMLRAWSVPGIAVMPSAACSARVLISRDLALAVEAGHQAVRFHHARRNLQPHAVLVAVEAVSRRVSSSHQRMPMSPVANTSRSLSPTRSTMAWKSSAPAMPCWMLLMIASSPARCSEHRVGRLQLRGALRHLCFEPLRPLRVVQRHGGLRREHAQEVAVGVVEAAERAVDVGVEVAQQPLLRDQRRDEARALVERVRAFGHVAQAGRARAARFVEPRRDRLQQRARVFARRQERAGDPRALGRRRARAARARRRRAR